MTIKLINIETILQSNLLCNYRRILHVYSYLWEPPKAANTIPEIRLHRGEFTSIRYRSLSIFLSRVLTEWAHLIEDSMKNISKKFV